MSRFTPSRSSPVRTAVSLATSVALYLAVVGATPCGPVPTRLMPDILSEGIRPHSRLEISPDGREIFWSGWIIGDGNTEWMFTSTWREGAWSAPTKLEVNGGQGNGPALSPDGDRLFFGAQRPLEDGGPEFVGIWYADRENDGWGEVRPVEATLDSFGFAGRPSLADNGTLYYLARGMLSDFPAVHRCRFDDGAHTEPELLSGAFAGEIVMDPWIDPSEHFLLLMFDEDLSSRPSFGSSDLFISYHRPDDSWDEPTNLGPTINTEHFDRSPSISPDRKSLIFIRAVGDVFAASDAHFYRVRRLETLARTIE